MKKMFFIMLILNFTSHAQQVEWAKQYPSLGTQTKPENIAFSPVGRIAVAGSFYKNKVTKGHFVYSLDTLGNIIWGDTLCVQYSDYVNSLDIQQAGLAFDANGKLFAGGNYRDTLHADGNIFPNKNGSNFFITKYNQIGIRDWIKIFPNASLADLFIDERNNLFVLLSFTDTLYFYGHMFVSEGNSDLLIAKLDTANNLVLYKQLHGTIGGGKIKVRASNNIFIISSMRDTLYFDTSNYSATHNPYHNEPFILKMDTTGKVLNFISLGNTPIEGATDIAINYNENIAVSGGGSWTQGPWADLNGYDSNFNLLFQKGFFSGNSYGSYHYLPSITMADTSGIWCWGLETPSYYYGTPNWYMNVQYYLSKIDFTGNVLLKDTFRIAGLIPFDAAQDITADNQHNLYVIAQSNKNDTITMGNFPLINSIDQTFIIAKLSTNYNSTVITPTYSLPTKEIKLFPNPSAGTFHISGIDGISGRQIKIYNPLGEKINCKIDKNEIDLSSQPKGIYFVEIIADGKRTVKKIVLE